MMPNQTTDSSDSAYDRIVRRCEESVIQQGLNQEPEEASDIDPFEELQAEIRDYIDHPSAIGQLELAALGCGFETTAIIKGSIFTICYLKGIPIDRERLSLLEDLGQRGLADLWNHLLSEEAWPGDGVES